MPPEEKRAAAVATGIAMLVMIIAAFALCQLLAGCVSVGLAPHAIR